MKRYPVPGLTRRQREVFEAIATGHDQGHSETILAKLLSIGAIRVTGKRVICQDRFGTVWAEQYEVPLPLHMEWCMWCAENYPVGEDAP